MSTTRKTICILVFILTDIMGVTSVALSDDCLRAICEVSSDGCHQHRCRFSKGRRGCGYFHIGLDYYRECRSPGEGWIACSNDLECSKRCVRSYLSLYDTRCTGGREPTCQDYARIHFGGPLGCHSSSTLQYWEEVEHRIIAK